MTMENAEIVVGAKDMASRVLDGISNSLTNVTKTAASLGPAVAGIGAGIAAAAGAMASVGVAASYIKGAADEIDALSKVAIGLGESTGDLQAFQFAMKEAGGIDPTASVTALQKIRTSLGQAVAGGTTSTAFEQLQLDAEALTMQGPIEQFKAVRDALAAVENSTERNKLAQELLGKSAADLLPALQVNAEAFAESEAAAKQFGLAVSDEQAAAIGQMNDAFGRVEMAIQGILNQLAGEFAPVVNLILSELEQFAPAVNMMLDGVKAGIPIATQLYMHFVDIVEAVVALRNFDATKLFDIASGKAAIENALEYSAVLTKAGEAAQEAAKKREDDRKNAFESEKQDLEELAEKERQKQQAAADEKAAERAAEAYAKGIEGLEKQLAVLQLGAEEVKRQEELALATNDAERERIELLQQQIDKQKQQNDLKKEAEKQANDLEAKLQKEAEAAAKAEADRQKRLAAPAPGLQAVESRLLTRGDSQNPVNKVATNTAKTNDYLKELNKLMSQFKFERNDKTLKLEIVGQ
jgi:DNA segregation ATPase FtsK/SpoIIIE-like protein